MPITKAPTTLVVLGATGDLMTKKIVPALFHLHTKTLLPPRFRLLGVSRRPWTNDDFKEHVRGILEQKVPNAAPADVDSFLKITSYHKLEFNVPEDYTALQATLEKMDAGTPANKLFYLSVPPDFYAGIFENIHRAHLADERKDNWTRIIVEKPFGDDEASAKALDVQLARLFKEDQIYRIDHYLAKEAFQNMFVFRFANNLFEGQWGNGLIERITAREFETVGAEDRGPFYEKVGALRDVGQNHLLQMIALATMDQPKDMTAGSIRATRAAILEKLVPLSAEDARKRTFRAQYDGYRTIKGVATDSDVETYFRAQFEIAHPRWKGVQFVIEAGKRLGPPGSDETTEIEVLFKHAEPCLCPPGEHRRNRLIFRQDPEEGITLFFWAKKPGQAMELEERSLDFDIHAGTVKAQYTADYGKLLLDCIAGDQTLFVSSEEIVAMWRFIDSILAGWRTGTVPLHHYVPDTATIVKEAGDKK